MNDRGEIREVPAGESLQDSEIDVTSVRGKLEQLSTEERRVYWKAIRRGCSSEQAMAKAVRAEGSE